MQDRIKIALGITAPVLNDNYIKLKENIDYANPIEIELVVGELAQVIINIINNSKDILVEKFIEDPWIQIDLSIQHNNALITIEDNGGGIPAQILDRIFEQYFTTKDAQTGTGLGLHMSKKIIEESLGGKLYVQNTSNGAKFFIELPLHPQ